MKRYIVTSALLSLVLSLFAAEKSFYGNSNTSLFGVPEYWAIGGADITFLDNGTALSNPSVLSLNSGTSLLVGYTGFYKNTFSTSSASFVAPINKKIRTALAFSYLLIPDIEITENLLGDDVTGHVIEDVSSSKFTYENASESFLNFSLGYSFYSNSRLILAAGFSLHGMRRRLIDWTGYGIGADFGITCNFVKPNVRLSLIANDFIGSYIHWSENYSEYAPMRVRLGFGIQREIPYIYGKIKFAYKSPDLMGNEGVYYHVINYAEQNPKSGSLRENPELIFLGASYGLEYLIKEIFAIRAGLDEQKKVNFGAGLDLFTRALGFDFAYTLPYGLAGTYSLSFSYNW